MSDRPKLYIAGIGMITPVGFNTAMTAAAVRAKISAYEISSYYGKDNESITMASVPNVIFEKIDAEINGGSRYNERHDRITKMAIFAIREACAQQTTQHPIPLVFAMPEDQADIKGLGSLAQNLEHNCKPWVSTAQYRSIHSGRAAGMEAINFAFRYLYELPDDFILIGGSDSYRDNARLGPLNEMDRLLKKGNKDGFAPGEAASFLLLTRHPGLAMARNGKIIAINPPGIADEPGHLGSDEPYRGEGLDQAFKKALVNHPQPNIHTIYSSMNGENHWAKEYGVAYIRNKPAFQDTVEIEHPAECYGDVGAATAPLLIALAAESLFKYSREQTHLVYSSSDTAKRGAIVVEKLDLATLNHKV